MHQPSHLYFNCKFIQNGILPVDYGALLTKLHLTTTPKYIKYSNRKICPHPPCWAHQIKSDNFYQLKQLDSCQYYDLKNMVSERVSLATQ